MIKSFSLPVFSDWVWDSKANISVGWVIQKLFTTSCRMGKKEKKKEWHDYSSICISMASCEDVFGLPT